MQGKQATIVSPTQERAMLRFLATTRSPARDRVMVLLSMKAGLRAKDMASLTCCEVFLAKMTMPQGRTSMRTRGGTQQAHASCAGQCRRGAAARSGTADTATRAWCSLL